jgi:formiminoglutamase
MIAHWVKPDPTLESGKWTPWMVGSRVVSFFPDMDIIPKGSVVVLGYEETAASAIRQSLYSLAWRFGKTSIVDIGNVRKTQGAFASQVIREIIDGGHVLILLGSAGDLVAAQYYAYGEKLKGVNAAIITDCPGAGPAGVKKWFDSLLIPDQRHLFHLSLLAYQRHFCDPVLLQDLQEKHHFELYSLGKILAGPEQMEPVLRDADMLWIDLSAVHAGTAPASLRPGPNGLDGIALAHLARYGGISDKLSSLSVGGWVPGRDRQRLTSQLAAQTVWYFLEGLSQRHGDFPASMDGLTEYHVDHSHLSEHLVFWKSNRSGRWWMQIPVREDKGHTRHRLVPCTYQDYLDAARDELPERLIQAQLRYRTY